MVPRAAVSSGSWKAQGSSDDAEGQPVATLERYAAGCTCELDAGDRLQLLRAVPDNLFDRFRLLELRAFQRHLQCQHVVCVETRIHSSQCNSGPNKQRGANEEHQRERYLHDNQDRPYLVLPESRTRPSRSLLQGGRQITL